MPRRTSFVGLVIALLAVLVAAVPAIQPTSAIPPTEKEPAPTVIPETPPTPESPPRAVDGGTLTCHASYVSGDNPTFYMARDEAKDAIGTFCNRISTGTVFKQGGTPLQTMQDDGLYGHTMSMSAVWSPEGRSDCPVLDFSLTNAVTVCMESLLANAIDKCNTAQLGKQFWKGGGIYSKDCIQWEIRRSDSVLPSDVANSTSSSSTDGAGSELRRSKN